MDEPGILEYPKVRRAYDNYHAAVPGKKAYINMLPICLPAQYKYGCAQFSKHIDEQVDTTYDEYIDEYCKAFDTPYICVDIYPCTMRDDLSERLIYPSFSRLLRMPVTAAGVIEKRSASIRCALQTSCSARYTL